MGRGPDSTAEEEGVKLGEKVRYSVPILNLASRLELDVDAARARCPFCLADRRTLALDPVANRYACEACGKQGVQAELAAQVKGLQRDEAVRWLAEQYQIKDESAADALLSAWRSDVKKKPSLDDVFGAGSARSMGVGSRADDGAIYAHLMELCPMLELGRELLAKRGYSDQLIEELQLGWVDSAGSVFNQLEARHGKSRLREAGLLDGRGYFLFNQHPLLVPFPVKGRVRFIRARRLDGRRPEWVSLTRKRAPLYPHDRLKLLKPGQVVYLVPDVTDALALLQRKLAAFALLEFASHPDARALQPFLRYEVVACGEPDDRGRAFNRAVESGLEELGKSPRVGEVPPGFDDWNDFRLHKRA
jgi:hypothetical protein